MATKRSRSRSNADRFERRVNIAEQGEIGRMVVVSTRPAAERLRLAQVIEMVGDYKLKPEAAAERLGRTPEMRTEIEIVRKQWMGYAADVRTTFVRACNSILEYMPKA